MAEFALERVVAEPWREIIADTQSVQNIRKSLCAATLCEVVLYISIECFGAQELEHPHSL